MPFVSSENQFLLQKQNRLTLGEFEARSTRAVIRGTTGPDCMAAVLKYRKIKISCSRLGRRTQSSTTDGTETRFQGVWGWFSAKPNGRPTHRQPRVSDRDQTFLAKGSSIPERIQSANGVLSARVVATISSYFLCHRGGDHVRNLVLWNLPMAELEAVAYVPAQEPQRWLPRLPVTLRA